MRRRSNAEAVEGAVQATILVPNVEACSMGLSAVHTVPKL